MIYNWTKATKVDILVLTQIQQALIAAKINKNQSSNSTYLNKCLNKISQFIPPSSKATGTDLQ